MGYFSYNNGIQADKPQEITLVHNPNFVTFGTAEIQGQAEQQRPCKIKIEIHKDSNNFDKHNLNLEITQDANGYKHIFNGVYDPKDVRNDAFLIVARDQQSVGLDINSTAYNLRACLLRNDYFRNNFDIAIVSPTTGTANIDGNIIELTSKGYGKQYDCSINLTYTTIRYVSNSGNRRSWTDLDGTFLISTMFYPDDYMPDETLSFVFEVEDNQSNIIQIPIKALRQGPPVNKGEYNIDALSLSAENITRNNMVAAMMEFDEIREVVETFSVTNWGVVLKFKHSDKYKFRSITKNSNYFSFQSLNTKLLVSSELSQGGADTIDNGEGDMQIEIDIYTDTGLKWGNQPDNVQTTGNYLTTLSKSYFGKVVWFDLNALMSKNTGYSPRFLDLQTQADALPGWADTGTVADYRFIARRTNGYINEPIFMSDVLYVVNGYDYTLNTNHLLYGSSDAHSYVLDLNRNIARSDFSKVKPLTTRTRRTHVKGQKQYFNFILKSLPRADEANPRLALKYSLYTQSDRQIGEHLAPFVHSDQLHTANTTLLDLDRFLPRHADKTVGRIDVSLAIEQPDHPVQKYAQVSDPLTFSILPSHLHAVNDFAFLNRLGGWDSVNFGGSTAVDFKTTSANVFKTLTPGFEAHSQIESNVYKTVEEQHTAQTSPISRDVAEWLRELSASVAVYELSTRRYVLIENMALKYNNRDDLFLVEMKYHYTDIFNGQMR